MLNIHRECPLKCALNIFELSYGSGNLDPLMGQLPRMLPRADQGQLDLVRIAAILIGLSILAREVCEQGVGLLLLFLDL